MTSRLRELKKSQKMSPYIVENGYVLCVSFLILNVI